MTSGRINSIGGQEHQQPRKAALDAFVGLAEARPESSAALAMSSNIHRSSSEAGSRQDQLAKADAGGSRQEEKEPQK